MKPPVQLCESRWSIKLPTLPKYIGKTALHQTLTKNLKCASAKHLLEEGIEA